MVVSIFTTLKPRNTDVPFSKKFNFLMIKKFLLVSFLAILLVTLGGFWFYESSKPASSDEKAQEDFLIPKGSSGVVIGNKLASQGLIRSALAFKIYIEATGKQREILAGEYRLSPKLSLFQIVGKLLKGPDELWVTIPEGLRREEITQRFIDGLGIKDSASFRQEFMTASNKKEGYLFPDTYLFPKTVTATTVVAKMTALFDKKVDEKIKADISASGRSLQEVVIMASIIERETKTDDERPIVAGILYKRLKIGMALQVDATVQYVVANVKCHNEVGYSMLNVKCEQWWPQTTTSDRAIKSPFNTYKYPGLPPSPIANPGLSSLKAAVYPTDSPYLYYLHDQKGLIHYAKTLEEHNQNIAKYL